jgi:pimeloyl-ACP methyl ester carboxylesterase
VNVEYDKQHQAPVVRWADARLFRPGTDRTHYVISPDRRRHETFPLETLWVPGTNNTMLVIFHGALPRDKYTLPRFEWLGTLDGRNDNLLFIADPALRLKGDLSIAWFTGTAEDDITRRAADLIRLAAESCGARQVLLLGGSAGGYAALMASAQVPGSRALAFSPQTTIAEYYPRFVRAYRETVFPQFTDMDAARAGLPGRLSALDVYRDTTAMTNSVHIVQNSGDDFHVENHLRPFLDQLGLSTETTTSEDGRVRVTLEYFSDGHGMPYRDILVQYVDRELDDMERTA